MIKDNKQYLERLSAIMKGLIIYKQEIELLEDLICKYPNKSREIVFKQGQYQLYMPIG